MLKLIELVKRAKDEQAWHHRHGKQLGIFAWFQRNSFHFSEEEVDTMWKLLMQVFDATYGTLSKFAVPGESRLEIFDSRSSHYEIKEYLAFLEAKVDKLKAFM